MLPCSATASYCVGASVTARSPYKSPNNPAARVVALSMSKSSLAKIATRLAN
jgi:hypothetical protein